MKHFFMVDLTFHCNFNNAKVLTISTTDLFKQHVDKVPTSVPRAIYHTRSSVLLCWFFKRYNISRLPEIYTSNLAFIMYTSLTSFFLCILVITSAILSCFAGIWRTYNLDQDCQIPILYLLVGLYIFYFDNYIL